MEALDKVLEAESRARSIRQKAEEDARLLTQRAQTDGEHRLADAVREAEAREKERESAMASEISAIELKSVGDAQIQSLALKKRAADHTSEAVDAIIRTLLESIEK